MKIDSGMHMAYMPGRQAARQDNSISAGGEADALPRRGVPTVGPSMPMPAGLANALWLAAARRDEEAKAASDGLAAEFMELSRMTAAERLRKEMLDALGLTEESLASLPPDERAAIEADIRRAIKEQLGIDETAEATQQAAEAAEA